MKSRKTVPPPIAIIGCAVRLPGGIDSLAGLWDLLANHRDAVTETADQRCDPKYFHLPSEEMARGAGRNRLQLRLAREQPGTIYTKAGGFLESLDKFDADFFGIGPREASRIDPQHRILLEVAWNALEDAGQSPDALTGQPVGVFVGISSNEYITLQYDDPGTVNPYTNSGGAFCMAANRLSYIFGFRGPSMSIDTACSSALVAIHQACLSLWAGESTLALAGGANAMVKPAVSIGLCQAAMLSPSGHCHSFDAAADGYVRGEGCGLFVLKPLDRAMADQDPIHAVIRGSAVNSDGRTQGISLPSMEAQESLLRNVYKNTGIDPSKISYVEAHGTGTPAGDPIECAALGHVLGRKRARGAPCYIGSVKSSLGHLEPASGAAGLAKVLVCLAHRRVPANLHFENPNPAIPFDDLGLKVVAEDLDLPSSPEPLRIGINSFGFGGTNAHLIVEEYRAPTADAPPAGAPGVPLFISARSESALRDLVGAYRDLLEAPEAPALAGLVLSATLRRAHLSYRLAACGASSAEVASHLTTWLNDGYSPGVFSGRPRNPPPKLAFVFSGNGAQHWSMARQLLETDSHFADSIAQVDAALRPIAGWSVTEELLREEASSRMAKTSFAQPALFALQFALSGWLARRGIVPDAIVGHSVGEIAAAFLAGALSLEDALRVVVARSRVQEAIAGRGAMAAVGLSAEDAEQAIQPFAGKLAIAAFNSPTSVTVSGDAGAMEELIASLDAHGAFARRLALNYPFHSHLLEGCEPEFLALAGTPRAKAITTPFVSTVTGRVEEGTALNAGYWVRNLRQPVRFREAIETLLANDVCAFIEIGPHPALLGYIHETARAQMKEVAAYATLNRKQTDTSNLRELLERLYVAGLVRDPRLMVEERGPAVSLPPYPWQRERYWNAPREGVVSGAFGKSEHPLLGYTLPGVDRVWRGSIELEYLPYLTDHSVDGAVVFPAAAFLEMALWAAHSWAKRWPIEIEDFDIARPLLLDEAEPVTLLTSLGTEDGALRIRGKVKGQEDEWILHAAGKVGVPTGAQAPRESLSDIQNRCTQLMPGERLYALAREYGLDYGPAFQGVEEIRAGRDEALGRIRPMPANRYLFHPAALDACLQVLLGLAARNGGQARGVFLPVHVDGFRLFGPPADLAWCHVKVRSATSRSILADFTLLDANGKTLATMVGFRFRALETPRGRASGATLIEHTWVEQPRIVNAAPDDAPTPTALVLAGSSIGREVAQALERRECRVVEVNTGAEDLRGRLDRLTGEGCECQKIVYFGDCIGAVRLIQALDGLPWSTPPQLWFVTENAWRESANPWQAPLWGVGRVAANEHPELGCRMVELCGFEHPEEAAEALALELLNPGAEDELLLAPGARYASRIVPVDWSQIEARRERRDQPAGFRLECKTHGSIDSLSLVQMAPPRPAPGQVLVRVRAAGLNFRDIMWTMGLLPPEALEGGYAGVSLGIECAGEIEAVGDGVEGFSPGDRVMAFGTNCFASHMATGAAAVARIPARLSFEEAATIPTVFLTCWYALREVAHLAAGERVLIHGAAGGVGLAAIQIAQQVGAEIFATAGNEEKREYLRGLGVAHVFDSRSLAFADQILDATGGEGVDVVLNSLSGAAMEKSLKVLRPFGRFLEIGKRDLYANTRIGLRALRHNISYTAIDADQLLIHKPQLAARMLEEVSAHIERGALSPLVHQVFPVSRAAEAFRWMQQSRHIGKIVLSFEEPGDVAPSCIPASIELPGDGAYLVSGGLSGFGLATAEWLVSRGARHVVLIGRRGAATPGCAETIARMEQAGAQVHVAALDITSEEAVATLMAELRRANTAVRGVVHAAMVLDDAAILDLDEVRLNTVIDPKALGAWNLHRQTLECPLDFFVLYSSAAALFGNPHQANYAAGNLFLESLARHRRAQGLPALAVGWGALGEVGYLARNPAVRQLLEAGAGVRPIAPAQALAALERLLLADAGQATLVDIDWRKWRINSPGAACPKYSTLPAGDASPSTTAAPLRQLLAGLDPAARRAFVIERTANQLARILGLAADKLDPHRALATLGLDSLMVAELHTIIEAETGLDLPFLRLLEQGSAAGLADFILREMKE